MFHKKYLYNQVKLLLLAFLPFTTLANQNCDSISYIPVISPDTTMPSNCRCDESIKNIEATLFSDLEIGAACGLARMVIHGPDLKFEKVDLENEKISYDRFKDGLMGIEGEIYLKGKLTLSGTFKHYPTGGYGDQWFDPDGEPIAPDDTPLGAQVREFNLSWSFSEHEGFKAPPKFQHSHCWEADAVIEIDGIWVFFGEQISGTFPSKFKVISVNNQKICEE